MADEDRSRSAASDEDEEFDANDDGYDDEGTLDEEEALADDSVVGTVDELRDLAEEGEMDIEELRRRYGYGSSPQTANGAEPVEAVDVDIPNDEIPETSSTLKLLTYYEANGDDEEDRDYIPYDKKEPRVDPNLYQVQVPEACLSAAELPRDYSCTTLWLPIDKLEEAKVILIQEQMKAKNENICLENCSMASASMCNVSDNEDLLYTLMNCGYDGQLAIKQCCENRILHANLPTLTSSVSHVPDGCYEHTVKLDEEEMRQFDDAFKEVGKNFPQLCKKFSTRKIGELVEYYYRFYKRSTRLDKLVMKGNINDVDSKDQAEEIRRQIKAAEARKIREPQRIWEEAM